MNFVKQQNKQNDPLCSTEEISIDRPVSNDSLLDSLTREAREITEVVLSSPTIFDALFPNDGEGKMYDKLRRVASEKARKKVRNKLRGKRWPAKKIQQGIEDLKFALN